MRVTGLELFDTEARVPEPAERLAAARATGLDVAVDFSPVWRNQDGRVAEW